MEDGRYGVNVNLARTARYATKSAIKNTATDRSSGYPLTNVEPHLEHETPLVRAPHFGQFLIDMCLSYQDRESRCPVPSFIQRERRTYSHCHERPSNNHKRVAVVHEHIDKYRDFTNAKQHSVTIGERLGPRGCTRRHGVLYPARPLINRRKSIAEAGFEPARP